MSNETKLENNYWVIGTNKWNANLYTKEEAEVYSKTLINCDNCKDCRSCIHCDSCSDCNSCRFCSYCISCCFCNDCIYCFNCSDCKDCRSCIHCRSCIYCISCSCCSSCSYCSFCSDFKTNPQRITSPILGTRNSKTTFYWNEEKEQIVCGCFKGTLEEFESKVKETHRDNKYAQDYLKWIDAVKFYKLTYGGNNGT